MLAAAAAVFFVASALVAFNGWPATGILGSDTSVGASPASQVAYVAPGVRRIAGQAGSAAASVTSVPRGPAVGSISSPAAQITGSKRVKTSAYGVAGDTKRKQGGSGSSNNQTGSSNPVTKVLDDSRKTTASTVAKVGDGVGSTVKKTTSSVSQTVQHAGDTLGNTVSKVSPKVGQTVQNTTSSLNQTLTNTGTVLGSTVAGVGETLAGALGGGTP
jgi:hypothetical protein